MTRKIKDALLNGENIYFRGHAQATYMSDGTTVEDAIINNEGNVALVDTGDVASDPTINDYISPVELSNTLFNYATKSDINKKIESSNNTITNIITLTQEEYDNLGDDINPTTLYIIPQ